MRRRQINSAMVRAITVMLLAGSSQSAVAGNPCEVAKLTADDGAAGDKFGIGVDFDGSTAVIGAMGHNEAAPCAGAAYVFAPTNGSWVQQVELLGDDTAIGDRYGWAVAINGDTIIVGSREDDDNGGNSGSAYVFVFDGREWSQQQKLLADDGMKPDLFGFSVEINGDTAAIGAVNVDSQRGAVYIFTRTGSVWTQQQKLMASDGTPFDRFGTSIALEGDRIAIGSIGDDDLGSNSGSVYIFQRQDGRWSQIAKLLANDGATSDNFGKSLALQGDTLVVGVPGDDDLGPTSGSAYVFTGSGEFWRQTQKLVASDGTDNAQFGESVSISGDRLVVGAWNDDGPASGTGSAYFFRRDMGRWIEQAKLIASDAAQSDNLGGSLAIVGDTVVIGAQNDDDNGNNSGSAYVFDVNCVGTCPWDLDGSGNVGSADLLSLLVAWGPNKGHPADFDGNGSVGASDLLALLVNWGPCP